MRRKDKCHLGKDSAANIKRIPSNLEPLALRDKNGFQHFVNSKPGERPQNCFPQTVVAEGWYPLRLPLLLPYGTDLELTTRLGWPARPQSIQRLCWIGAVI